MNQNHPSYGAAGSDTTVMAVKMRIGRLSNEERALSKNVGRARTGSELERLADCRAELMRAKAKLAKLG